MSRIKFANVVFGMPFRQEKHDALFYRTDGQAVAAPSGEVLSAHSCFDFTTYFNSLSVAKLRLYSTADAFFLRLKARGGAAEIERTLADNFSHAPKLSGEKTRLERAGEWRDVEISIIPAKNEVLSGFEIRTFEEPLEIKEAWWEVEAAQPERVFAALVSTTFKKERYIEKTVSALKEGLFEEAKNAHFFVIDNGRTLDPGMSDENVTIIPNPNVGGSGGFARGMLEALKEKGKYTHVLLMDDDVELHPESVKRTLSLLSILKPEWKEAFVAGAMLNFDKKTLQMEDVGFMTRNGRFAPQKPVLEMDGVEGLVRNETFRPILEMRNQGYASWWYCAIPIKVIRKVGLPMPLFLRGDDAEYSQRAGAKLMTMNSIGLWHEPFQVKYSAAVERYQVVRNVFSARFLTGFAKESDFFFDMKNSLRLELKKFGYDNASLILDGFEDFFRGPRFLANPLLARKAFEKANRAQDKMVGLQELQDQAKAIPELEGFDVNAITFQDVFCDFPRTLPERALDFTASNRQRFLKTEGKGYAVISANGWEYPAGKIRGKRVLVLIDWFNKRGCIRVKDKERFAQISKRYARDLRYFKAHESHLRNIWSAAGSTFASMAFWEKYLKKAQALEE